LIKPKTHIVCPMLRGHWQTKAIFFEVQRYSETLRHDRFPETPRIQMSV
jgi:hypothetical protein